MEKTRKFKTRPRLTLLTALLLAAWLCCGSAFAVGQTLIPGGRTVGLELHTPGVLVVGLAAESGASPAAEAGIRVGDLITALDGRAIGSTAEFLEAAAALGDEAVEISVLRGGKTLQFHVKPKQTAEGRKLGVWLRDSISGIGTLTFVDPESGFYGALGHPISDVDTGTQMPLGSGVVTEAEIIGVRRGACGLPGELYGKFDCSEGCGSIQSNTVCGIFGFIEGYDAGEALPVAEESEIHTGKASILSNVRGQEVAAYEIEIEQLWHGEVRNLCFSVTDETLLAITGGIVQGMSGSPIIQDGKLVGAVTHVLVNDPTRGYGIFIENMLEAAG